MKVISVAKLIKKQFKTQELSEEWASCLGKVAQAFIMIIWGPSFAGKSNFLNALIKELAKYNTILYVALEESFSTTSQEKAIRHNLGEMAGKVRFANHETSFEELVEFLQKKRSPTVVVIDSLQYIAISYTDYKHLKQMFPRKTFIFVSHAKGKNPDGKTAEKIRYDAGIKVRVEGFIAHTDSRYGGNKNYVVWEQGAKNYWKKAFKNHLNR